MSENLQMQLDNLDKFCKDNEFSVNIDKTNIVIFGSRTSTKKNTFRWTISSKEIAVSDTYTCLGILLHQNGSFKHCITSLIKKGQRENSLISSNISNLLPSISLKIFKAIVEPII